MIFYLIILFNFNLFNINMDKNLFGKCNSYLYNEATSVEFNKNLFGKCNSYLYNEATNIEFDKNLH